MKILITGGAGFIGKGVLNYLVKNYPQHEYRALDLLPCTVDGPEKISGSILDYNSVTKAVRGCDVVIHLAAFLGVKQTDGMPMECLKINIEGTVNLLEASARERIKKFVFASSSEVYGYQEKQPITENHRVNPISVYGVSKIAGEEYVKAYSKNFKFDYSIMRFFNVYGPSQQSMFVMPLFVNQVMNNESPTVYGDGKQIRSFSNVKDIAQGASLLVFKDEANGQVFNIGNNAEPISMGDLAWKVIKISGKNMEPNFISYDHSDRLESRDVNLRIPDITKAESILGYKPHVSLDQGVKELLGLSAEKALAGSA